MDRTNEAVITTAGSDPAMGVFDTVPDAGRRQWYYLPRGSKFFTRNSSGNWTSVEESTARKVMQWEGLSASLTKEDREAGQTVTKVDEAVIDLKLERFIHYAGKIAGWPRGLHVINGKRVLVTEELDIVRPVEPDSNAAALEDGSCRGWPILGKQFDLWMNSKGWHFVNKQLRRFVAGEKVPRGARAEDDGFDQRPYFFGWLARWYSAVLAGEPAKGHAMVFAGNTGCGKTLLVQLLERVFGGESAQPYCYLMGGQFNSDLMSASVLTIDDEVSKTDMKSRKDLGARVKQFVAVPNIRIEGKGTDALILSPINRLIFAVNLTADNLSVLPPPSEDLIDPDFKSGKIMLLKINSHGWAGAFATEAQKKVLVERMYSELPYFLHWLLNRFELPADHYDERFGVVPWTHPEILEALDELSPWRRILDCMDKVLWGDGITRRVMTASMVVDVLRAEGNGLPKVDREGFKKQWLHLNEMAQKVPERVVDLRSVSGGRLRAYAIFKAGHRKDDAEEDEWIRNELKALIGSK